MPHDDLNEEVDEVLRRGLELVDACGRAAEHARQAGRSDLARSLDELRGAAQEQIQGLHGRRQQDPAREPEEHISDLEASGDVVQEQSEESFPASDPPGSY